MAIKSTSLATFDQRGFFDKALRYGVQQNIIAPERVKNMEGELAPKGVQIANYFGTAHLRPELELPLQRMIKLISLCLEDVARWRSPAGATSLLDKTLLAHSKGGSEMLKRCMPCLKER